MADDVAPADRAVVAGRGNGGTDETLRPATPRDLPAVLGLLRPATSRDLPAVLGLLRAADLPADGVDPDLTGFVVAEWEGRIVAAGGLEVYGGEDASGGRRDGLLRSVVVDPGSRGRGLGEAVTRRLLAAAEDAGLRRVHLLTTTAAAWFPRLGFREIDRDDASEAVKESVEFREACPASATTMVLELGQRPQRPV